MKGSKMRMIGWMFIFAKGRSSVPACKAVPWQATCLHVPTLQNHKEIPTPALLTLPHHPSLTWT